MATLSDVHVCVLSHVQLFVTPWIVAHQSPLSMRFSRQENWSVLPFPSPEDLPDQGSNPCLFHWQAGPLPLSHLGAFSNVHYFFKFHIVKNFTLIHNQIKYYNKLQYTHHPTINMKPTLSLSMAPCTYPYFNISFVPRWHQW